MQTVPGARVAEQTSGRGGCPALALTELETVSTGQATGSWGARKEKAAHEKGRAFS